MITILRRSGLPLDTNDIERYRSEWKRLFDVAEKVCKKDQLRMMKKLEKIELGLRKRFKLVSEIPVLDSKDSQLDIVKKYGPVILTTRTDTNDLCYLIDDVENMQY